MQLLGNYKSTLSSAHYQQLVTLLRQAIQAGDFGGGQTFDQPALVALQQQAQAFTTLPLTSAGQLVTDESFNRPLSLLVAQFGALLSEATAFDTQLNTLLSVLDKDTVLIDQLLAQAAFKYWASTQPILSGGVQLMWDFGAGYGPIADPAIAALWTDPATGAVYSSHPELTTTLIPSLPATRSGLAASSNNTSAAVNNLTWTYTAGDAQVEVLEQATWTKLTLLEPQPLINFSPTPQVVPAASPFVIAGISNLGSLPVYVQTVFVPRRGHITLPLVSGQTVSLSAYKIDTDQVVAFVNYGVSGQKLLSATQDYILDTSGKFTPLNPTGTSTVDVFYVEEFPAYKCSIDQVHWSPVRMLDTARPYPDDETDFLPITFSTDDQGNLAMPITDELGVATGLSIRMGTSVVSESYLLEAMCVASPDTVGAVAQLEVDFAQAGYLNILRLTPFTTFPMVLKKVEVQGLLDNTRQTVWSGSVPLNQSTAVRLDAVLGSTPLVAKAFLTFYQPNYTLKQQTVTPPDALRRDIMGQLQTVLPFYARNVQAPLPAVYTGAQYEFGVADVSGQCWTGMPGVFTSGPHQFAGCPEVIRFDAEFSSAAGDPALNRIPVASGSSGVLSADTSAVAATAVDLYLCYQAFNAAGVVLDENLAGVALSSGAAQVFPFGTGLVPSAVDHVDIYIKIVHRTLTTVVERYMLQVTAH